MYGQIKKMLALWVLLLLSCFSLKSYSANQTVITITKSLKDPQTIVSNNSMFTLGFFSPPNSSYRFLGIWYTKPSVRFVVWVANKNSPLHDSSGVLQITKDGNIEVQNNRNNIVWSTNVSHAGAENISAVQAQLQDTGNLVLESKGNVIWQSFDHPADTFLPHSTLNFTKESEKVLRSWKSLSDPSESVFTAGVQVYPLPQLTVWEGDRLHWRSGPWNGNAATGVQINYVDILNYQLVVSTDKNGTVYISYYYPNKSLLSTYTLSTDGKITQTWWDESKKSWEIQWQAPTAECDYYGKCGPFGICNSNRQRICECLKGFEPTNKAEWNRGEWTNGCVRKKKLHCESGNGKEDGFLRLKMIKVPEHAEWRKDLQQDECKSYCLSNCSCKAYGYDPFIGCMTWSTSLIDIQEFSISGMDLYLRLSHSELGTTNNKSKVIIALIGGSLGVVVCAVLLYFLWRRRAHQQVDKKKISNDAYMTGDSMSKAKLEELPLFSFQILAVATNNFHRSHKLGQGGFGSVYRGILEGGEEIAVKRLSKGSKQGIEEFMNEVMVISKLQHRNLVRLLGCCVDGDEKMLVYEYLRNKSLDAFLFVPEKQKVLDWNKRLNIIEGICRGLHYLHRDSIIRIIHRDLKASNILLDEDLDPKISDFGMARIFGGDQDEADTRRVVGTYGYMSPEYAMQGMFSEKSDVFSFGVLLLEIISGKRNKLFSDKEHSLTLLGHAWNSWNEKDMVSLIDPLISQPQHERNILRCTHIGLLCVQELAKDRPSMSDVLSMLHGEISDLPDPNKPGFARMFKDDSSCQQTQQEPSANYVTNTDIHGR